MSPSNISPAAFTALISSSQVGVVDAAVGLEFFSLASPLASCALVSLSAMVPFFSHIGCMYALILRSCVFVSLIICSVRFLDQLIVLLDTLSAFLTLSSHSHQTFLVLLPSLRVSGGSGLLVVGGEPYIMSAVLSATYPHKTSSTAFSPAAL